MTPGDVAVSNFERVCNLNEREQRARRDRFAAAALTGLVGGTWSNLTGAKPPVTLDTMMPKYAECAAVLADLLIAELDKEQK